MGTVFAFKVKFEFRRVSIPRGGPSTISSISRVPRGADFARARAHNTHTNVIFDNTNNVHKKPMVRCRLGRSAGFGRVLCRQRVRVIFCFHCYFTSASLRRGRLYVLLLRRRVLSLPRG